MCISKTLSRGSPLGSWPRAVTSPRRRDSDEINFWKCQIFWLNCQLFSALWLNATGQLSHAFCPLTLWKSAIYWVSNTWQKTKLSVLRNGQPWYQERIYLLSEWRVEHEVSGSALSVCSILCVMSCVFIRERTWWNHCNTIEYRSVGGHTLSS